MARKMICAAVATATLALAGTASAGTYSDDLGKCFVRATSEEDKTVLIQWIFAMMSLNPSVKPLTNVSDVQRDAFNRKMGALTQRLFTVDCRKEAVAAIKYEGAPVAFRTSFELLGKAATSGLVSDPAVSAHAGDFSNYMDQTVFAGVFKEAGVSTGGGATAPR